MDTSTRAALGIAARYFILGALWVLLSDRVVDAVVPARDVALAQTLKGWLFMAFVAVLLFSWVRRELRRLEESRETLRATEANLGILLNQSLTGVFAVRDDRFTYTNDRFNEIFGHPPGTLTGQSVATIIEEGERVRVRHQLERAGGVRPHGLAFRALRADGSVIHAEAQITQTELDGQEVVLGMLVDVTQRKVEEARYAAARRLEAVGRMAGGVAHDFNNLLTAISGAAELLRKREGLPQDAREDVQVILDTAERGASLSRHLLAFSRSRVMRAEPVDVSAIIRSMQPLLRRLVYEEIDLETQLEADPPPILADRNQVEQIVLNLVVNARDAMPEGGTLRIRTASMPAAIVPPQARTGRSERVLRLLVEDTGVGIPRELHARVFEPFFTTKGEEGTGLGLATVQGVVAQTGGQIMFESAPGRTAFSVYFPVAEQVTVGKGAEASTRSHDARRRGSVLIVEDEPVVRAITRRALEKAGFPVVEAQNGAEARQALLSGAEFVVVLLDMTLPDESGVDIARLVLQHENGPAIVFMSGYSTEDVPIPDDIHPAGFVEKPFTVDEIASAVTRACH
ncbi:MAG: hybrid sensor histidine kinase/response regulator [Longimicrobiales bacterium]